MLPLHVLLVLWYWLVTPSAAVTTSALWDHFLANTSLDQRWFDLGRPSLDSHFVSQAVRAYDNFYALFYPSTGHTASNPRLKRDSQGAGTLDLDATGRSSYASASYGYGGTGGSYGCASSGCCCKSDSLNDLLPILALIALSLLLLYLIQRANNNNNTGRRKRSFGADDEDDLAKKDARA